MKKTYMLDTNICSFIMREQPETLLKVLQGHVENKDRLVISAITYSELRFGAIGKKASPRHVVIVDQFMERIDGVLPWDRCKTSPQFTTRITSCLPPVSLSRNHRFQWSSS